MCGFSQSRHHFIPNAVTLPRQYSNGPSSNSQLTTARVAIHLAVIAAACLPGRRNNAAPYHTRAIVSFDASDIDALEDQPYPCRAGLTLGRNFDRGRIDFARITQGCAA
jgi:hypothetical protein